MFQFVSRQNRGFSLVELLAVIGIIGVLVGLLIPAVQAVRGTARKVQCQSNLRQIGIAMERFLDRHGDRGRYPDAVMMPSVAPERPTIRDILKPYVEQNDSLFGCPCDTKYFAEEGISYEYRSMQLAGKTRAEALRRRNGDMRKASELMVLYDFDPWHADSRNVLYADGHADSF